MPGKVMTVNTKMACCGGHDAAVNMARKKLRDIEKLKEKVPFLAA